MVVRTRYTRHNGLRSAFGLGSRLVSGGDLGGSLCNLFFLGCLYLLGRGDRRFFFLICRLSHGCLFLGDGLLDSLLCGLLLFLRFFGAAFPRFFHILLRLWLLLCLNLNWLFSLFWRLNLRSFTLWLRRRLFRCWLGRSLGFLWSFRRLFGFFSLGGLDFRYRLGFFFA